MIKSLEEFEENINGMLSASVANSLEEFEENLDDLLSEPDISNPQSFNINERRYSTHNQSRAEEQQNISDFQSIHEILSRGDIQSTRSDEAINDDDRDNYFSFKLVWVLLLLTFLSLAITFTVLSQTSLMSIGAKRLVVDSERQPKNVLDHFPTSYEVFVPKRHNQLVSIGSSGINTTKSSFDDTIPVFFDLQGLDSDFTLSVLTDCFQMKKDVVLIDSDGHLGKEAKVEQTRSRSDFIYTNSLCGVSKLLHEKNKKAKLYTIMYNPILRSLISFKSAQDESSRFFDEKLKGLSFHQYLAATGKTLSDAGNAFTKAILCKDDNYKVSKEDYLAVREYLEDFAVFDVLKDYQVVFDALISDFPMMQSNGKMTAQERKCVSQMFSKKCIIDHQMFTKHIGGNGDGDYLEANFHDANEYDSMLYGDKYRKQAYKQIKMT